MSRKHNLIIFRREGQKVFVRLGDETLTILIKDISPGVVSLLFTATEAWAIDRPEFRKPAKKVGG